MRASAPGRSHTRPFLVRVSPPAQAHWCSKETAIAWLSWSSDVVFRIIRYAQNLPLWSDECFLSVNFINRGYRELLEPLDNGQIAPPLFLWAQRFFIDLGGFSEWSLRIFPLACGLTSVFLFWHLAQTSVRERRNRRLARGRNLRRERASDSPCIRGQALRVRLAGRLILMALAVEWLRQTAPGSLALGAGRGRAGLSGTFQPGDLHRGRNWPGAGGSRLEAGNASQLRGLLPRLESR